MGHLKNTISPQELDRLIATARAPRVVDVRRKAAYDAAGEIIAGAVWHDHQAAETWAEQLAPERDVVVYCVHGHQVSQSAAAVLRAAGVDARYLVGGIEAFRESGGLTLRKDAVPQGNGNEATAWVFDENPGIPGLAGAWLIRRLVDTGANIHFVSPGFRDRIAAELGAAAVSVERVDGHGGLAALAGGFGLSNDALGRLAAVVDGAAAASKHSRPESPGLAAVITGICATFDDDLERLGRAIVAFDALYAWCRGTAGNG